MNKIIIAIAVALILIIGGAGVYLLTAKPGTNNQSSSNNSSKVATIQACDLLTESVAKSILGDNIQRLDAGTGAVSTVDINQTNCFYNTKINPSTPNDQKTNGLQVVAAIAKSELGAANNLRDFKAQAKTDQKVEGIGDDAFYSSSFHQLFVLKGSNYYVLYAYVDTPANPSLDTEKLLAKKLSFK